VLEQGTVEKSHQPSLLLGEARGRKLTDRALSILRCRLRVGDTILFSADEQEH